MASVTADPIAHCGAVGQAGPDEVLSDAPPGEAFVDPEEEEVQDLTQDAGVRLIDQVVELAEQVEDWFEPVWQRGHALRRSRRCVLGQQGTDHRTRREVARDDRQTIPTDRSGDDPDEVFELVGGQSDRDGRWVMPSECRRKQPAHLGDMGLDADRIANPGDVLRQIRRHHDRPLPASASLATPRAPVRPTVRARWVVDGSLRPFDVGCTFAPRPSGRSRTKRSGFPAAQEPCRSCSQARSPTLASSARASRSWRPPTQSPSGSGVYSSRVE